MNLQSIYQKKTKKPDNHLPGLLEFSIFNLEFLSYPFKASAPPTISKISLVIAA